MSQKFGVCLGLVGGEGVRKVEFGMNWKRSSLNSLRILLTSRSIFRDSELHLYTGPSHYRECMSIEIQDEENRDELISCFKSDG